MKRENVVSLCVNILSMSPTFKVVPLLSLIEEICYERPSQFLYLGSLFYLG